MPIKELRRNGGFSDATLYKWRAKFGGKQVSDAHRLRELESENTKLKRLLAEAHLHMHALKSVLDRGCQMNVSDITARDSPEPVITKLRVCPNPASEASLFMFKDGYVAR